MKKILCLLFCMCMFALCACGSQETASGTEDHRGNQEASAVGKINWNQKVTVEMFFDTEATHLPTLADFRKLETGMTFEEIVEIIGRPHIPRQTGMLSFGWRTAEGETILLFFYGGGNDDLAADDFARYRYCKTYFSEAFFDKSESGVYPGKPWKDNEPREATGDELVLITLAEAYFRKSLLWNASECDNYEAYASFYDTEDKVYIISFAPIDTSVTTGEIYHVAIRAVDAAYLGTWSD